MLPAVQGSVPPVQTALELYNVLSKSDTASLRQPVGLEQQLLTDNDMDTEVGQSMLQLLKVNTAAVPCSEGSTDYVQVVVSIDLPCMLALPFSCICLCDINT